MRPDYLSRSPDHLSRSIEIDPAATALPRGTRPEPVFESRPLLVEFDEPAQNPAQNRETGFNLKDIGTTPVPAADDRRPLPLSQTRRQSLASWAMAAGVYLVTLLLLLPWDFAPTPVTPPIPIQLVMEEPPPPPPPPPQPPPPPIPPPPKSVEKPPQTALASVEIGQKSGKPDAPEDKPQPPPPPPPPETKTAAVSPPPKPAPPPALTSALPKPTAPESAADLPEPTPPPPLLDFTPAQPRKPVNVRAPPKRYPSPRDVEFEGPPASRNEYLAYCEALILRHRGSISDSFLAGRQGSLTLTLLVLGDGTISRITVARSSGYQDIDSRVEQMISAVGRFPPLPQWFQGSAMPLMYHFAFPVRR